MVSRQFVFWDVDTQVDFMQPEGKLHVPGAEKLLPNLIRLTEAARSNRVFLVSEACVHAPNDETVRHYPAHCIRGTRGAAIVQETMAGRFYVIPNRAGMKLPPDLSKVQQVILEKQSWDVFDNPNTEKMIERLKSCTEANAEFVLFGVMTEHSIRLVAKGLLQRGRRVMLVRDAVEALDPAEGRKTLERLATSGARLVTTAQALALLDHAKSGRDAKK